MFYAVSKQFLCRAYTHHTHTHTVTTYTHSLSFSLSLSLCSSSAEPTEEQPPDTTTPQQQQQVVIQPQADLIGGNLLDLLDISAGPTTSGPAYNAPAGGGGGK